MRQSLIESVLMPRQSYPDITSCINNAVSQLALILHSTAMNSLQSSSNQCADGQASLGLSDVVLLYTKCLDIQAFSINMTHIALPAGDQLQCQLRCACGHMVGCSEGLIEDQRPSCHCLASQQHLVTIVTTGRIEPVAAHPSCRDQCHISMQCDETSNRLSQACMYLFGRKVPTVPAVLMNHWAAAYAGMNQHRTASPWCSCKIHMQLAVAICTAAMLAAWLPVAHCMTCCDNSAIAG